MISSRVLVGWLEVVEKEVGQGGRGRSCCWFLEGGQSSRLSVSGMCCVSCNDHCAVNLKATNEKVLPSAACLLDCVLCKGLFCNSKGLFCKEGKYGILAGKNLY